MATTAYLKDSELANRLQRAGVDCTREDANTLRRAELALQRWGAMECGDSNEYSSWAIERDEKTDRPYKCIYPHKGEMRRYPIADREKGALRRVAEVCNRLGLHYHHQTDPRGCALYVAREPLTDSNYNRGIACC